MACPRSPARRPGTWGIRCCRSGSVAAFRSTTPFSGLPIEPILPAVDESLAAHGALVLQAPPGAGKTTLVPLALREATWLAGQAIVMLEPRRLAARAAAFRIAQLLGEPV